MQINPSKSSVIAAVVVLAAQSSSVAAFTSPSGRPLSPYTHSPLFQPKHLPIQNTDLLRASTAANSESNPSASDAILRSLEKQEAAVLESRAAAMAKVSEAEKKLETIQQTKQQYLNGLELAQAPPGGNFSETTMRSAVKAFLWRIIAGSVTFFTSLRFSGSLTTALSIVGSDFFSKSFTMFIGERIMNKSQAGRKAGSDGAGRSLAKALIWRLFAICNTLTMAVFVAKDLSIASKIAGSDAIFKTALMFFYERAWAKIEWGKEYNIEFSI